MYLTEFADCRVLVGIVETVEIPVAQLFSADAFRPEITGVSLVIHARYKTKSPHIIKVKIMNPYSQNKEYTHVVFLILRLYYITQYVLHITVN